MGLNMSYVPVAVAEAQLHSCQLRYASAVCCNATALGGTHMRGSTATAVLLLWHACSLLELQSPGWWLLSSIVVDVGVCSLS